MTEQQISLIFSVVSPQSASLPTVHNLFQYPLTRQSGSFVTTDDPTLAHCSHPKCIVLNQLHSTLFLARTKFSTKLSFVEAGRVSASGSQVVDKIILITLLVSQLGALGGGQGP